MDAVNEFYLMKVNEQSNRDIEQLHVAEKLDFVDGQHLLNRFELQQQAALHQDIEPERFLENESLYSIRTIC